MALSPAMIDALRLTREGKLNEAMAAIRGSLHGGATPPADLARGAVGKVIDLVAERVAPRAAPDVRDARPDAPPPAGSFEERTYRGAEGAMGYRLYRPAGVTPGMPLIVMLHGCTQDPDDFARGTGMNRLAEEFGFLVAYPRQSQSANPQKCWNWFRPGDQARGRGEPALIAAITRAIVAEEAADGDRVYVAGLSAGGAAAAIMAAEYPDIYAAVGIHSGLACGAARDLPGALAAMQRGAGGGLPHGRPFVPVITFHGDRDMTVNEANAREIVTAATAAAGVPLVVQTEAGRGAGRPHSLRRSTMPDGRIVIEQWTVAGAGHAWSGGNAAGSYTDPAGPDASREMVRFFLTHNLAGDR